MPRRCAIWSAHTIINLKKKGPEQPKPQGGPGERDIPPAPIIPNFPTHFKSEIPKMTSATDITDNLGRRSFLTGSAAALALATSLGSPVLADQGDPDPILAAIEAHRAVTAMAVTVLKTHADLERELPRSKRQSTIDAFGETIVATDDPRWIDSERAVAAAWDAQDDAASLLVSIVPTTTAGVIALLQYANTADLDGNTWPTVLHSDDGLKSRSWHYFMIENVSAALTDLVQV